MAYSVKNEVSSECPLDRLLNITLQWIFDVFDHEPGSPSLRKELQIGAFPSHLYHAQGAQFIDAQTHPFEAEEFYQGLLKSVLNQKSCRRLLLGAGMVLYIFHEGGWLRKRSRRDFMCPQ